MIESKTIWNAIRGNEPEWDSCSQTHRQSFAYMVESVMKTGVGESELEQEIIRYLGEHPEWKDKPPMTLDISDASNPVALPAFGHADEIAHREAKPQLGHPIPTAPQEGHARFVPSAESFTVPPRAVTEAPLDLPPAKPDKQIK